MSDSGKGSTRRPREVSEEQFMSNWELVFGKKKANTEVVLNTNSDKQSEDNNSPD